MRPLSFTIAHALTRIFLRDRQTIIFSLLFPVIFMVVFGFVGNQDQEPISLGIVNNSSGALSREFIEILQANPLFETSEGEEQTLRESLIAGDITMVLLLPPGHCVCLLPGVSRWSAAVWVGLLLFHAVPPPPWRADRSLRREAAPGSALLSEDGILPLLF